MAHTLSERQLRRMAGDELSFAVEAWTSDGDSLDRVLSRNSNLLVARAAFRQACEQYPTERLTLRQGCRVIEERAGERPTLHVRKRD